jgi:transcription elongation GreA/GreB family factor
MSRAFVKEGDGAAEALPELAISPHPNWVTSRGLALLQARVETLESERAELRSLAASGATTDAATVARIERDLRYFRARLTSAKVVTPQPGRRGAHFGSTVVLAYPDGKQRRFQIVGEDEADPSAGLLSWVAPLARALEGAEAGDPLLVGGASVTVVSVSA